MSDTETTFFIYIHYVCRHCEVTRWVFKPYSWCFKISLEYIQVRGGPNFENQGMLYAHMEAIYKAWTNPCPALYFGGFGLQNKHIIFHKKSLWGQAVGNFTFYCEDY